jgi:GntR family transcriptional regulator, transcriptional repressor for pyruvate dehydrogenase complex
MPFEPITVVRSPEQVARQIETQIYAGEFTAGKKLPTERELCEQFNVSRSVIREAVKMLDALGLVESRQGSGIFVRHTTVPIISRALTLLVATEERSVHALYELRELLEARTAADAARNRNPEQLAAIEAALADNLRTETEEGFYQSNERIHLGICEAAGNPYFTLLIGAIMRMQREVTATVMRPNNFENTRILHQKVVAAIVDGDPEAAADAMRAHIRDTMYVADDFLSRYQFERGHREETLPSDLAR